MPLLPSTRWPAPDVRLGLKTTLLQGVVLNVDLGPEADSTKGRKVYLVSLAHPKTTHAACGRLLVAPESLNREQVLEKFLASCAMPVYMDARSIQAAQPTPLKYVSVFREFHKEGDDGVAHAHYHIGVVASRMFMFLPVKRALMNFGLASHWSTSHDGYWSVVRYLWWPSPPKKPDGAIDKLAIKWAAQGFEHPDFDECCSAPMTAKALGVKRLKMDREAAETQVAATRITELDVWPIVVKHSMKNSVDDNTAHLQLMAWAKTHGTAGMQMFLFKNRARLPALIEDIWQWEHVEQDLPVARMSRMELLRAAANSGCKCRGQWADIVKASFEANGIDAKVLCSDILNSLQEGRGAATPVVTLAGSRGGEGKSALLKGMLGVFGVSNVFLTPDQGNFPLMGLPGKKVALLDEWRFNDDILSLPIQMQWFEGSQLTITRPQNVQGASGHFTYEGSAPVFASTKLSDLSRLSQIAQDDPATGQPKCAEASMLLRRLRVYRFTTRIAKPKQVAPFCGCCFAKLVLSRGDPHVHKLWEVPPAVFFV